MNIIAVASCSCTEWRFNVGLRALIILTGGGWAPRKKNTDHYKVVWGQSGQSEYARCVYLMYWCVYSDRPRMEIEIQCILELEYCPCEQTPPLLFSAGILRVWCVSCMWDAFEASVSRVNRAQGTHCTKKGRARESIILSLIKPTVIL